DSMILKSTFEAKVAISDSDEETNQWYFDQGLGEYLIGNIRTDEYFYILLFGKCNTFRISLN
ncbi:MAG: hypothetical protein ACHQXG_08255, partial [Nitrososphaerales archaeon]